MYIKKSPFSHDKLPVFLITLLVAKMILLNASYINSGATIQKN